MPLRKRLVHRRHDLVVRQHPIGIRHPDFAKIAHSSVISPSPKLNCARRISIMASPRAPSMWLRTQQLMIELADVLDRPLQLLIIVEPAANLGDPLATHAELLRAPASVSHGQHEHLMPFAARAFRAALGVSDDAVQQRAT